MRSTYGQATASHPDQFRWGPQFQITTGGGGGDGPTTFPEARCVWDYPYEETATPM
jgi:hypothetical protein